MAVKIQPRFDFESRKPKLPEVVRVTTRRDTRTRNQWICPFCNSGSAPGEGHDGALTIYADTWRFYCFSCHAKGDVYDYIRLFYGITDIKEQAEKIDSLTGFLPVEVNLTKTKPKKLREARDFTSYLLECEKALSGSPGIEYLHQRGFSDENIHRFHLGYDRKYCGITIPYPETRYYLLRYLHPKRDKYYKPHGEKEPLFIIGDRADSEWLVMESQLDAISLHQAGATNVCAFGGGGFRKLSDMPNIKRALIVSDADGPGRKTAKEVGEYLQKMGAVTEIVEPPQPFKDGNEVLSKSPTLLSELVVEWESRLSNMGIILKPEAFTDLNEAELLFSLYGSRLRFSRATRWMRFTGTKWEESDEKARELVHDLLRRQLEDAKKQLAEARKEYDEAVESGDDPRVREALQGIKNAEAYRREVLKFEATNRISAILTEATPTALIDVSELDSDPYILNTPTGTIDLRTGTVRPNTATDFCTKSTACGVSDEGREEWDRFLRQFTGGDEALQTYLQEAIGMTAIGAVSQEKLLIAYGSGGNGKSTFFNTVARVLGDYAGGLSAESLTINNKKNSSPEFAELRGKRLVIASELQEGMRLDTSIVKKICSTDMILAEKKYRDPFSFRPSHNVVLFTNHLPKVGSNDMGTWDRLVVIPLKGRFRNTDGEILNYSNLLFERCGGAVLKWITEGAKRFLENKCRLSQPQCVTDAIAEYRDDNDWLGAFLDEKCKIGQDLQEKAGDLLTAYRYYCKNAKEWPRSSAEFKTALVNAGFYWRKETDGSKYYGLKLKDGARPDSFVDVNDQMELPPSWS